MWPFPWSPNQPDNRPLHFHVVDSYDVGPAVATHLAMMHSLAGTSNIVISSSGLASTLESHPTLKDQAGSLPRYGAAKYTDESVMLLTGHDSSTAGKIAAIKPNGPCSFTTLDVACRIRVPKNETLTPIDVVFATTPHIFRAVGEHFRRTLSTPDEEFGLGRRADPCVIVCAVRTPETARIPTLLASLATDLHSAAVSNKISLPEAMESAAVKFGQLRRAEVVYSIHI